MFSALETRVRPQLFEGWITLSNGYIKTNRVNRAIRWIEIYLADSVINLSNNPGLDGDIVLCSWARHLTLVRVSFSAPF